MPRVSFVIPVLHEEDSIGGLLSHLREQYPDCELLVVDGGNQQWGDVWPGGKPEYFKTEN